MHNFGSKGEFLRFDVAAKRRPTKLQLLSRPDCPFQVAGSFCAVERRDREQKDKNYNTLSKRTGAPPALSEKGGLSFPGQSAMSVQDSLDYELPSVLICS